MKYYKNTENEIFGYEDDSSQDEFIRDKILITKEEVIAINELKQKEAEELMMSKMTYAELRVKEYNKLNQLEMQFDDAVNNTTIWIEAINEIKAKYPKPNKE